MVVAFDNNSKKYDYDARGEEEPQDIDPDSVPDDPKDEDGLTIRERMFKTITEVFYPGWELSEGYKSNNRNVNGGG